MTLLIGRLLNLPPGLGFTYPSQAPLARLFQPASMTLPGGPPEETQVLKSGLPGTNSRWGSAFSQTLVVVSDNVRSKPKRDLLALRTEDAQGGPGRAESRALSSLFSHLSLPFPRPPSPSRHLSRHLCFAAVLSAAGSPGPWGRDAP